MINAKVEPRKVREAEGLYTDKVILLRDKIDEIIDGLPATKYIQNVITKRQSSQLDSNRKTEASVR